MSSPHWIEELTVLRCSSEDMPVTGMLRHAGLQNSLPVKQFLQSCAAVISRAPKVFLEAVLATCSFKESGGRSLVVLRKPKVRGCFAHRMHGLLRSQDTMSWSEYRTSKKCLVHCSGEFVAVGK